MKRDLSVVDPLKTLERTSRLPEAPEFYLRLTRKGVGEADAFVAVGSRLL